MHTLASQYYAYAYYAQSTLVGILLQQQEYQLEQAFRCPPELCHRTLTTPLVLCIQYLLQGGRNKLPARPSPRARLSPWTEAGIPPLLVHTRLLPYFYLHTRRTATCILYGFARKCLRHRTTRMSLILLSTSQYYLGVLSILLFESFTAAWVRILTCCFLHILYSTCQLVLCIVLSTYV